LNSNIVIVGGGPIKLVDWASKKSVQQQQDFGISFSSQVLEN
jgi:hypothetical protein